MCIRDRLDVQKLQLLVQYMAFIFLIMLPYIKPRIQHFSQPSALISIQKNCQKDVVRMATQGPEGRFEVVLMGIHKGRSAKIEIFRPRLPHSTLGRPTFWFLIVSCDKLPFNRASWTLEAPLMTKFSECQPFSGYKWGLCGHAPPPPKKHATKCKLTLWEVSRPHSKLINFI